MLKIISLWIISGMLGVCLMAYNTKNFNLSTASTIMLFGPAGFGAALIKVIAFDFTRICIANCEK